jgi:NAD(P)-dependent dehydrogenase (short-subunit alcohol dehydrogenase family)
MSNSIEGKVVVITGASSGLGEATARLLSTQGASVVLGARRADRLLALVDTLTGNGGKATALTADVTRCEQVKALVEVAVQTYGRIDVMINNAGLMPQALLERLQVDQWDRMIDVNLKGVLYGIAAALPHMKQQKAGHVINVSSVAGYKVEPRLRGLRGHQTCRAGAFRRTTPGSEALQHPDNGDLAGRGGDGAARQRDRPGRRGANPQVLCGGGDPGRLVRPRGRLRHRPARGR